MEFEDILTQRRACHHFIPGKTIPKSDLENMVAQAALTPSGYNAQPWEFVVVQERQRLQDIQSIAYDQPHVSDASALVVVLADTVIGRRADQILEDWVKLDYCTAEKAPVYHHALTKPRSPEKLEKMGLRNAALAAMTFIYAAENMGYATCPMMGVGQLKLKRLLNVPADYKIALLIAVGYRDEGKAKPRLPRRSVADMLHWETFQ